MQFKQEITINTSPTTIFEKYTDVSSWKEWDTDVKESSLIGEFIIGSSGSLTPTKGPKAKFVLTEVTVNQSFTSETKLPLCVMVFRHELETLGDTTKVTHSVSFTGITSFIFSKLIGESINKALPGTLKRLKEACE